MRSGWHADIEPDLRSVMVLICNFAVIRRGLSRLLCAGLFITLLPGTAFTKTAPMHGDGTVDAEVLAEEIKHLRENLPPNEAVRRVQLDGCQRAQELLQEASANLAEAKRFKEALDDIPSRIATLQSVKPTPQVLEETGATPLQILAKLAEKVRQLDMALTSARNQLSELETNKHNRTGRQIELARQLADARSALETLTNSPDITGVGETHEVEKLNRIIKWAGQAATESKIQALAAELLFSQSSGELRTLQISDAQLRVAQISRQLAEARQMIIKVRADGIREAITRTEEKLKLISTLPGAGSGLKELADRNLELLTLESGPDSLHSRMDRTVDELDKARADQATLRSDFERMQKRVAAIEAAGGRTDEALALLLREHLEQLPARSISKNQSRILRKEIVDAMVQLDNIQDERMALGEEDSLPSNLDIGSSPEALELGRDLLQRQRFYLDSLTTSYGSYLQTLTELQVAQKNIADISGNFSMFINERVLWIRSAPQWSFQNLGHRYVMFLRYWPLKGMVEIPRILGLDLLAHRLLTLFGFSLLALLQWAGPRMRARSQKLAAKAVTQKCTAYLITLEECAYSFLLALKWPLLMLYLGWRLSLAETIVEESFVRCVGNALMITAIHLFLLQFFRRVYRPKNGLGEAHLGWQPYNIQLVRRHLVWFIPLIIGFSFVLKVVELQGFDTTCGQVIFFFNMILFCLFTHFLLRPKKGLQILNSRDQLVASGRPIRLALYLIGMSVPLFLLGVAYLGYYFSALEIANRVLVSLWAAWALYLASSLICRWFLIRTHRFVIHDAEIRREAKKVGDETGHPAVHTPPVEITAIDQQTSRLLNTLFWISIFLSITYIWSETIPALKSLDSVKLWQVSYAMSDSKAPAVTSPMPVLFGVASAAAQSTGGAHYVTLLDLLEGFLVLLVMITASRNLPGLLKITFLSRMKLEQGVDHAAVTMVRYVVVLIGLITISNLLSLDWSKIQWIAAAFSLGIAFGLQELFANFISGLIILFERPIRLGDIISVGEITGTVTRINIRATRLTDADRRDFLVPNKNFITGNVLNWTLSDPVTRVTLPVGVAYGSDTALTEKLLCEAAAENVHILKNPAPVAVLGEFGGSTLNFKLFVFIPNRSIYQAMLHQLTTAVERKFREAGLNIAFPQQDVHLYCDQPLPVKICSEDHESH